MKHKWMMAEEVGYDPKTTFWDDFSIADVFGIDAVKDTFDRAFSEWKTNHVYLTELVLVLNHKLWQHYSRKKEELARCYERLWRVAENYALETLKDDELEYYYRITD